MNPLLYVFEFFTKTKSGKIIALIACLFLGGWQAKDAVENNLVFKSDLVALQDQFDLQTLKYEKSLLEIKLSLAESRAMNLAEIFEARNGKVSAEFKENMKKTDKEIDKLSKKIDEITKKAEEVLSKFEALK